MVEVLTPPGQNFCKLIRGRPTRVGERQKRLTRAREKKRGEKMAKQPSKRAKIQRSLTEQLALKGAALDHYEDLLRDYMSLWDIKERLIADIKARGVVYQDKSASGVLMWKNNPSIKELRQTEQQMLNILRELELKTDDAGGSEDDEL